MTGCDRVQLVNGMKDEDRYWFDVPTLEIIDKQVYDRLQNVNCNKYDDIHEAVYDFGTKAKDTITGYIGIIIGKCISINGDISYGLAPKYELTAKDNNATWFDESRIQIVEEKKQEFKPETKRTGGAVPNLKIR